MRAAIRIFAALAVAGYPLAVYLGLTRFGMHTAAWLLLVLSLALTAFRSHELRRPAWGSALVALLSAVALGLDDQRYVLAIPVLINLGLFVTFFGSLRAPQPIVERFARMRVQDLSPAEIVYCRSVTKVWSAFFVLNGATAALLAALGALRAWALYTGLISYLLIGLLGATEYSVRKYRFGRYGNGPHDRLLRALMPARTKPP